MKAPRKVNFKSASSLREIGKEIDQWVATGNQKSLATESEYRFSMDMPRSLHKRIKKACVDEGVTMKEKITEVLLKTFPEK